MKAIWILILVMLSVPSVHAGDDYFCEYRTGENSKQTKLAFSLPSPLKFGLLIPVTIKAGEGSPVTMNTVVLKDYPYLVLADVYRIESNNSRIALIKISPDRSSIEMAHVNMGTQQAAKFYQGNCFINGGQS